LIAAPPASFGFLDAKPAQITVDGSRLRARGTIGLIGGPVAIRQSARIRAPAGTTDVASVAGNGEVPVNPRDGAALAVQRFGRAKISGGALLDVANPTGRGHSGSVFIRSGTLAINAATIDADNYGSRTGGEIVLRASGRIALRNRAAVAASAYGSGAGGRLSVSAGRLTLDGGAQIASVASGTGNAGPVAIAARSILIDGRADPNSVTLLASQTEGAGNAGDVRISAGDLTIRP
jgi:hypothetical protein